jgi:hypothetical protein
LEKHTGLFLNKWFLKMSSWNETDIRARGQALADKASTIWPSLTVAESEHSPVQEDA